MFYQPRQTGVARKCPLSGRRERGEGEWEEVARDSQGFPNKEATKGGAGFVVRVIQGIKTLDICQGFIIPECRTRSGVIPVFISKVAAANLLLSSYAVWGHMLSP